MAARFFFCVVAGGFTYSEVCSVQSEAPPEPVPRPKAGRNAALDAWLMEGERVSWQLNTTHNTHNGATWSPQKVQVERKKRVKYISQEVWRRVQQNGWWTTNQGWCCTWPYPGLYYQESLVNIIYLNWAHLTCSPPVTCSGLKPR